MIAKNRLRIRSSCSLGFAYKFRPRSYEKKISLAKRIGTSNIFFFQGAVRTTVSFFKGTVIQIEKALIYNLLRILKIFPENFAFQLYMT